MLLLLLLLLFLCMYLSPCNNGTDIALGYFSNLEFGTDFVVSLPCVKDLARFTRMAAERARLDQGQRLSATAGADLSARGPQQTVMSVSVSSVAVTDFGFRPSGQIDFADAAADMTIPQDVSTRSSSLWPLAVFFEYSSRVLVSSGHFPVQYYQF